MGFATAAELLKAAEVSIPERTGKMDPFGLAEEVKTALLQNSLKGGGRKAISSLLGPISKRRNYGSIMRNLIQVQPLPQGALPIYAKPDEDDE